MSVPAKRADDVDERHEAGSFEFYSAAGRPIAGMIYVCPCGCGREGALPFRPCDGERASWQWDGNTSAPTLTPSVHHIIGDETHWHGWLTAGVWKSC